MKEYRPTGKNGSVDITWPRLGVFDAMIKSVKVRIETTKARFARNVVAVRVGMIYKIETLSFSLQDDEGVNFDIDYALVVSVEDMYAALLVPGPECEAGVQGGRPL